MSERRGSDLKRLWIWTTYHSISESFFMADPSLPEIYFKNKMAWVLTTHKSYVISWSDFKNFKSYFSAMFGMIGWLKLWLKCKNYGGEQPMKISIDNHSLTKWSLEFEMLKLKLLMLKVLWSSMLVTDVGDEMYWWQVWDVGDRFNKMVHWGNHQRNEKRIIILSPTS